MTERVEAPFTQEQCASLNQYQFSGVMHPFTCAREHGGRGHVLLVALPNYWVCPHELCDYTQGWAWRWMADWTWLSWRDEQERLGFLNPELRQRAARETPESSTEDLSEPDEPEQCPHCEQFFLNAASLSRHISMHAARSHEDHVDRENLRFIQEHVREIASSVETLQWMLGEELREEPEDAEIGTLVTIEPDLQAKLREWKRLDREYRALEESGGSNPDDLHEAGDYLDDAANEIARQLAEALGLTNS